MTVGGWGGPYEHRTAGEESDLRAGREVRVSGGADDQDLLAAVPLVDGYVCDGIVAVVAGPCYLAHETALAIAGLQFDLLGTDQNAHWALSRWRLAVPVGGKPSQWRVDERAVQDAIENVGLPDEARELVVDRTGVQILWWAALRDLAVPQHRDEIGE